MPGQLDGLRLEGGIDMKAFFGAVVVAIVAVAIALAGGAGPVFTELSAVLAQL